MTPHQIVDGTRARDSTTVAIDNAEAAFF